MKTLRDTLLLFLLAAAFGVASYRWHPHRPELYMVEEKVAPGEIFVAEAMKLAAAGQVVWFDARRRQEFEKGHVPDAILLNDYEYNDLLPFAMQALQAGMEKKVIVYCDAMKCTASHHIAEGIRQFFPNPENVFVLRGGWPAWEQRETK